eukprot:966475_1
MDCDYQGPDQHQYDHRQPEVRQYFVDNVLGGILFGNPPYSQYLDGVFLDTIAAWIQPYALCYDWNCTKKEYDELWNASLQITKDALKYLQSVNKIASVSIGCDLFYVAKYYLEFISIVIEYKDHAVRYYEDISNGGTSSLYITK